MALPRLRIALFAYSSGASIDSSTIPFSESSGPGCLVTVPSVSISVPKQCAGVLLLSCRVFDGQRGSVPDWTVIRPVGGRSIPQWPISLSRLSSGVYNVELNITCKDDLNDFLHMHL